MVINPFVSKTLFWGTKLRVIYLKPNDSSGVLYLPSEAYKSKMDCPVRHLARWCSCFQTCNEFSSVFTLAWKLLPKYFFIFAAYANNLLSTNQCKFPFKIFYEPILPELAYIFKIVLQASYQWHCDAKTTITGYQWHCNAIATITGNQWHCNAMTIATITGNQWHCNAMTTITGYQWHCNAIATVTGYKWHCNDMITITGHQWHCSSMTTSTGY